MTASVEALLAGRRSSAGRESFRRWLEGTRAGRPPILDAFFANDDEGSRGRPMKLTYAVVFEQTPQVARTG